MYVDKKNIESKSWKFEDVKRQLRKIFEECKWEIYLGYGNTVIQL